MIDPDARLQIYGPEHLADHELLAFLLTRGGAPGAAALRTAEGVLRAAGGLGSVGALGDEDLVAVPGVGPARAQRIRAFAALGARMAGRRLERGAVCDSPRAVFETLRGRLDRAEQERLVVLLLDARLRLLREVEVARGSANTVYVHARDVFRPAVKAGASAVVLAHNHPSGDPSPSAEDLALTGMLVHAGKALGIEVCDHVIVAEGRYCSLAETGGVEGLRGGWGD